MKKKIPKIIRAVLIIIIIVFIYIVVRIHMNPESEILSKDKYIYKFDPSTVVSNINTGKSGIFEEVLNYSETDLPNELEQQGTLSYDEYDLITTHFFSFLWNEDVVHWKLVDIWIILYDCEFGFNGIPLISFTYQNDFDKTNNEPTMTREITISSWDGVIVGNQITETNGIQYNEIDKGNIIINPEEALKLIGADYGNLCLQNGQSTCNRIRIDLNGNAQENWVVKNSYQNANAQLVEVNIKSGEINRIK